MPIPNGIQESQYPDARANYRPSAYDSVSPFVPPFVGEIGGALALPVEDGTAPITEPVDQPAPRTGGDSIFSPAQETGTENGKESGKPLQSKMPLYVVLGGIAIALAIYAKG